MKGIRMARYSMSIQHEAFARNGTTNVYAEPYLARFIHRRLGDGESEVQISNAPQTLLCRLLKL